MSVTDETVPSSSRFPAMGWRRLLTSSGGRLEEMKTVAAPPFAESVSEGDVRWEKCEFPTTWPCARAR